MDNHIKNDQDNRNYGIDLLRLVAMFMIVVLHVLGQGGILSSATGYQYVIAWLLEITAYCAVNCYAMISGYVCYSDTAKTYHYKKFLSFWVQVFVYSFGITLLAFLIKPESVGIRTLILSLFPIASKQYWYASAYAGLFFVIPWINKLLKSCTKKESTRLVLILTSLFMLYGTFANKLGDCFSLNGGYSMMWLVILYIIGAWMKKCHIPTYFNNCKLMIGVIGCILLTWMIKIFPIENIFSNLFISYISITIIYIAFAFVIIFSKLQLGNNTKKIIKCFSPAAFGVYLIHCQSMIWGHFMSGAFTWILDFPWWLLFVEVLISAMCIFICCLFIEKVRLILFHLLGINRFVDHIAVMVCDLLNKIYNQMINKYRINN